MAGKPDLSALAPLIADAAAISGEADLDRVLATLVDQARQATGARYAALGVLGEHGLTTAFIYEGVDSEVAKRIGHPPTGRGVLGTVIRENAPIVLDHISEHPDSVGFPEHHPHMESFLGVPVSSGDEAFGNLYLADKDGGFTEQDVAVVDALSRIAGAAVQTWRLQVRLRRMAVIEDRQRIARDLHDSVIQDLFAVGLQLQGVGARITDPEAGSLLLESIDTLERAVHSLRRHILELRETVPSMVLAERLQLVAARMGSAYTARVVLTVDDTIPSGDWDDELVLLATEALSNALRHSGAANVELNVTSVDSDLLVEVKDDGRGFDPGSVEGGLGLANMRTRAKSLGGEVTVQSEQGKGTTVLARVPISRPSRG